MNFDGFIKYVDQIRFELPLLLYDLKTAGMKIIGLSAPAKGNTLLNYCRIGPEILDYVTDISPLKIGKYTPGTHIPVVDFYEAMENCDADYGLILACNFKLNIMKRAQEAGFNGKFIIPYPELEVK